MSAPVTTLDPRQPQTLSDPRATWKQMAKLLAVALDSGLDSTVPSDCDLLGRSGDLASKAISTLDGAVST